MNIWIFVVGYAAIQSLLLIYLLSTSSNKSENGIYYLVFLLLATTYVGLQHTQLGFRQDYPNLFFLGFSPMFLIPPLYYLFIQSNLKQKSHSYEILLHFVPFVLYFLILNVTVPVSVKKLIFLAFTVQLIVYSYLSFRLLNKSKSKKQDFSPNKVLWFLNLCMLGFAIGVLVTYVLTILFAIKILNLSSILIVFLVVLVTVLEIHMAKSIGKTIEFHFLKHPKYKNSNLRDLDLADIEMRLNSLFGSQMVFLDINLTSSDIAQRLNISRHQLTEYINQQLGYTFNDFVNKYRVDYVKSDLINREKKHLSISGLAHDAGFKSSATFYRVFKKHTGMTPSEYINQHS